MKYTQLRRFKATDGIVAIIVAILFPLVVSLSIYALAQIGVLPRSLGSFIISDSPTNNLTQYGLGLATEAGVIVWYLRRRGVSVRGLGMRLPPAQWWWVALGLYFVQIIVIAIVIAALQALAPAINLDEVQDVTPFGQQSWAIWVSCVASVGIAPTVEEILFRGLIFGSLKTRLPVWLAAVIAASIFGFLHGQLNAMIYTFVFGLLLTWLYFRSHSLLPGILLHTLNNAVAFWVLLNT